MKKRKKVDRRKMMHALKWLMGKGRRVTDSLDKEFGKQGRRRYDPFFA